MRNIAYSASPDPFLFRLYLAINRGIFLRLGEMQKNQEKSVCYKQSNLSDLSKDTSVRPLDVGPGWYVADLPANWNFYTPSGGVLMTIALRAMKEELGDDALKPLSATTVFCSPVPHGPMEIRVNILRRSAGAAQLRAALTSTVAPGPGLEVIATFARDRKGLEFLDAKMPNVPGPKACDKYFNAFEPDARASFLHQVDMKLASGHRWFEEDWPPGKAEFSRWMRYHESQMIDGIVDPLALPPLIDFMPPALAEHQGAIPFSERIFAPSLDLTVYFLEDLTTEWQLIFGRCRQARAGYATGDIEIWSEDGRLVAVGSQMMILRKNPNTIGVPKVASE